LIAFVGGALGLLLAYWGIAFRSRKYEFQRSHERGAIEPRLERSTLRACCLYTLRAPLRPRACSECSRTDVNNNLKEEGRSSSSSHSHSRLRTTMVTCQIALALFLLVGTGLLFRGIFMIEHQNLGFRADHLLTANVVLDAARYKDSIQQVFSSAIFLPQLTQLPGVEAVAATSDLPAAGPGAVTFRIQGQSEVLPTSKLTASDNVVSSDFFPTAGIPLLRGRAFTEQDTALTPRVIVVNQNS